MNDSAPPAWVYNETVRMFATPGDPPFEDPAELARHWGRVWGLDNDVGRIRAILLHRPGPEMAVVDPTKRIESIGSFGDIEEGWYFQSDTVPPVAEMQAQHDALAAALEAAGVEVYRVKGVAGGRLKSCYTRDPLIMVKGGAIVCRMGTRIRRGEELAITRTLADIGVPILRTISGTGLLEGGSFAWLNAKTLALVNPFGLPYVFLEQLKALGVRAIEISPADNSWIVNSLAIAPGELLMPEGATNRTLDQLARHGVKWTIIPFAEMQLNGGGIHCSTTPLIRDPV